MIGQVTGYIMPPHFYSKCGFGFALAQSIIFFYSVWADSVCRNHFWEKLVKNSFIPKIG